MRILIAPDSFKHSLSAKEVASSLAGGIRKVNPDAELTLVPVADGGEGTVQSLVDATGGQILKAPVHDPLMRKREAFFGVLGDGVTAVIEMAAASGIELLKDDERDPMTAGTYGTGELMKAALDRGCRKLIIGIGGSATNDGGAGMAAALGVKLFDADGNELAQGGGALYKLAAIDIAGLDERLRNCEVIVAADVTNPLTGPEGASHVYGSQKGADKKQIELLDRNLAHYAAVIKSQLKIDIEGMAGAGAAGGLGAGLVVFAGATIRKGFDVVKEVIDLEIKTKDVDLVITGEGKIDRQTKFGKTPYGVAMTAKKFSKPVIAVAGLLGDGYKELYDHGFKAILPISENPIPLEESIQNAAKLLQETGERIMKLYG